MKSHFSIDYKQVSYSVNLKKVELKSQPILYPVPQYPLPKNTQSNNPKKIVLDLKNNNTINKVTIEGRKGLIKILN